jgi:hypothetical protein
LASMSQTICYRYHCNLLAISMCTNLSRGVIC